MNTQGWIRGIMAKNQEPVKYLQHVVKCLGDEFELESNATKQEDNFIVKLGIYAINLSFSDLCRLQQRGAYCLDKYLLDQLQLQGFEFDKRRSQYVRYCYGLFYRTEHGTVY